jgi:hypothetical protein
MYDSLPKLGGLVVFAAIGLVASIVVVVTGATWCLLHLRVFIK